MSQFPNTSDTLDLLREPAGGNFLRQSAGLAAPMNRFYFDRLGNTTGDRLQPKGGFFGQIGRQLVEGEASLSTLNPVGRGFITSGAEWLAGAFSDRAEAEISVPGPFISDAITKERKFMVDGVPTPAEQVNISDMWRNLPVEARIAMQTAGFDVTTLSNLGIGDAQTFSDRWPDLLNAINSRQLIQDYADKRPIRSGLATATTFGVNIVTDPVVIGTLGAGAVAKVAARSTIRESLKQASARAAVAIGDGPGLSVAKKALLQDRMLAARMLYQPSSVAAGSSYMLTADIASQERNLLYGMGDIEDGVKLSFGTAAVGGLIGLAGSELALRLVGRSHGTITNKVYRDADEINSYAKARVEARMSNSPGFEQQGIDWDEVITEEFVEDFAAATYRPDQARRVGQALDDIDLTDDTAHAAVTNFMTKFPTAEELETFLKPGVQAPVAGLKVFHGTQYTGSLDKMRMSVGPNHDYGEGFYFSTNPVVGQRYAEGIRNIDQVIGTEAAPSGGVVREVYLDIKKPLDAEVELPAEVFEAVRKIRPDDEEWQDAVTDALESGFTPIDLGMDDYHKRWTAAYKKAGYDGIVEKGGDQQVVVFSRGQIMDASDIAPPPSPLQPRATVGQSAAKVMTVKQRLKALTNAADALKHSKSRNFKADSVRRAKKVDPTQGAALEKELNDQGIFIGQTKVGDLWDPAADPGIRATTFGKAPEVDPDNPDATVFKDQPDPDTDNNFYVITSVSDDAFDAAGNRIGTATVQVVELKYTAKDKETIAARKKVKEAESRNETVDADTKAKAERRLDAQDTAEGYAKQEELSTEISFGRAEAPSDWVKDTVDGKVVYRSPDTSRAIDAPAVTPPSPLQRAVETGETPTTRYETAKAELDRLIAKRLSVDPASKSARGINAEIGRVQDEISSLLGPELLFRSAGLPERQGLLARQLRAIASELPSTAFTNPNQRRARLTTLFTRLAESAKDGSYNTSALIPYMQKQMNKIGAAIGNPGQRARLFMASEKPTVAMIGRLFNVVSDRPFHRSERITMPDGTELMSTASRRDELDRDIIDPFKIEYINVIQRMTEQERSAFSANVLLAATGKLDDADDMTRQVAEFLRSGYDSTGARGVRAGYLSSVLDNYVHILLNKEITEEAKDAFIRKWSKTYGERFDSRLNANPEIHYNTLLDLGLVTKAGNRHITIEGVILRADGEEGLPKTLNEMSDEFKADYTATLPDTIANEGRLYLHRRGSKADKNGLYDPELELETDDINGFADPSRLRARGDYVRSDISRKVAQDILLDREILESGLVNLDLAETLDAYMRSTGYNIVRQETLTQLVGEPIRFPEFLAVLRNVAGDDPEARKAVDLIELTDRSQANRLRRDQELSVFTTTVAQVGSAVVNAAIVPTILATEGGVMIGRLMSGGATRGFVDSMANAFARLADSNLARLDGVDSAMESLGRVWSSTADLHMAHDLQTSKWARTSRTGNELVRTVTFERPLTRFLKSMHYDMTYGKLDKYRNKLDRLYGLQMRPDSIEELKGVARQAGIDWRDLDMFQRKGLLNDNVLDGAKHALSMDPKALTNVRRMEWVIANTPPGPVRDNVSDLNRIMRNWAYEDAQALIATPDATSRVTLGDKTPMSNLLQLAFGFTSWAMTFQNRTMARMSNSAPWKQVSFLSYFVAAETMNSVYRDVVTNGKSPEEVSLDWEENGAKKFGAILLRLPQFGIINPLTSAAELALAGGNTQIGGMSNLVSSPVLGMTDRALRATLQGGQQVMNGEPLSDSVKDSVYRLAPGANFWYVTLLRRLRDDFE